MNLVNYGASRLCGRCNLWNGATAVSVTLSLMDMRTAYLCVVLMSLFVP